jgi:hypothetical protein
MPIQRNKNWNDLLVTEEVRSWHEAGKPLYSHYMRQNYQELLAAGIRYFGTWRAAVEAAGIPYDSVRKYRDWSKERIIETIQRLEKDGVDLSFRSMMLSKYAPMVYAAIRPNHFGSWKDALTAAGLAPEEIYRYRSWDDDSILSEIRRLKEEGADLSSKKMDETSNPLIATARRRFGNWGAAVERAGIDYSAIRRRRRWTSEIILQEIRQLRASGGRPAERRSPSSQSGSLCGGLQGALLWKLDQGPASLRGTCHDDCRVSRGRRWTKRGVTRSRVMPFFV